MKSCCFLLNYHQEQIRRRKGMWVREIFLKRIEQGVYHNLLQEIRVNGRESYFRLKVRLCPLLFIKILLKTAQLLSQHFPSGLSLCIIYFLFHKGKDTSAIPQPSVQHLVYVFPIFFRFHKYFNKFHLKKNIVNKFFH